MSSAVALAEEGQDVRSNSLIEQVVAMSTNKDVDAAKVEAMANLAMRMQDREISMAYAKDFAAAVSEMPRISKQNRIVIPGKGDQPGRVQGKFASWENIDKVIRPILSAHNLVLTFKLGTPNDGGIACTPILTHRTTGFRDIGDTMRVPPDTSGSKNAAQAVGSSSSYAKRYAACAMLNIVTEDEDRDGTNYPLATDELNDRQQRVVDEAHQAHKDGNYQAYWGNLTAQDRQLLVLRGVHAELTGAPQLPGPRTLPADAIDDGDQPEPEPEREIRRDPPPRTGQKDEMAERYIAKIESCENTDQIVAINDDQATKKWLGKLKAENPQEHERATTASSRHFATLMAKEDAADRDRLV